MHFAEQTVFIDIASLIWAFNIEAPLDKDGTQILPDLNMDNWDGVLPCKPLPFAATYKPRGPEVSVIVKAAKDAL